MMEAKFRRSITAIDLGECHVGLDDTDITYHPVFAPKSAGFQCYRADHFGVYAVALAYRWSQIAATFLVAAKGCEDKRLHAPAVLCAYTAAYHTLHAYLAVNGRVILDRAHVGDGQSTPAIGDTAVAGRLDATGSWRFGSAKRTHDSRWKEVKELWLGGVVARPQAFDDLYGYLYADEWKVCPTLDSLTDELHGRRADHPPTRWTIEEKLDEFLDAIAETRHEAHYRGFGADAAGYDALMNGEDPPYGLEFRATAMLRFAHDFLCETAGVLGRFLGHVQSRPARSAIRVLAHARPFNSIGVGDVYSSRLAGLLSELAGQLRER